MYLIGINGFKRAGKGTVGDFVWDLHEGMVHRIGFADKLKVYAARSLGHLTLSPQECIALMDRYKDTGLVEFCSGGGPWGSITGRQYLQNIGNEARKLFGDTFWIDQILPRPSLSQNGQNYGREELKASYEDFDCVAITDLRYPNEAGRVRALGGVVWEVIRPGTESDGHDSEQRLPRDLVDWQIPNVGSLDDLRVEVERAMAETLR